MHLETKFLRLRTLVTIGSRFGDWQVTSLGGWTRGRLSYLVMVVKIPRWNYGRNVVSARDGNPANSTEMNNIVPVNPGSHSLVPTLSDHRARWLP
jgi:hypothetical protein